MRIIVGLGNPGQQYAGTPHNLGFLAIDALAEKAGIRVTRPESKSFVGLGKIAGHDVALAKPQTMMNLSGAAVVMLLDRYECTPSGLIVITDDVAIPWGMIRVRENGSAGGHNGMKSVIGAVGTTEFLRVRLGVQPEHQLGDLADYVLGPINASQRQAADDMIASTSEAIEIILTQGAGPAMTRFNRRATPPDEITA
jgi:peptidyl-tRNA hydrolase, PTH1 family